MATDKSQFRWTIFFLLFIALLALIQCSAEIAGVTDTSNKEIHADKMSRAFPPRYDGDAIHVCDKICAINICQWRCDFPGKEIQYFTTEKDCNQYCRPS